MKTYQQAGNAQKTIEAAQKLLQASPNNLTGLVLMAYFSRANGQVEQAAQYAEKGQAVLQSGAKPEGMSDADYAKLKTGASAIFAGAIGAGAFQKKDYPTAAKNFTDAVMSDPNSPTALNDIYPLALSYLEQKPINPDGLFWIARATVLAQNAKSSGAAQIENYGKRRYMQYHGAEDGWPELVNTARTSAVPPQGLKIAPAPSPAEQAAQMCQQKTPDKMGFGEWEFIFTSGNQQCSDTVWNVIKGKKLQMQGKVLDVTPTVLKIAATEDAITANTAEITLNMTAAIPAKLLPKQGATLLFEGQPDSYTPNPFMMTMSEGTLLTKSAPPATTKKPAAGRTTPRKKPAQ